MITYPNKLYNVIQNLDIKLSLFCIFFLLLFSSCLNKQNKKISIFDKKEKTTEWDNILNSGELIIGTISGPNSFYEINGTPLGIQYNLVNNFAEENGLMLRIKLCHNIQELCNLVKNQEIDIAAYNIPDSLIKNNNILASGYYSDNKKYSWACNKKNKQLSLALNTWFQSINIKQFYKRTTIEKNSLFKVKKKIYSPYISKEKGIISVYDSHFKEASKITGWDWKLIAAQCYQESAFDPNATSYVGAKGLMQIMPKTAESLGLKNIFSPKENIISAAHLIKKLQRTFNYIKNPYDRIKFILASYNAGLYHIKDAQSLAKKYGKNPESWQDTSEYIYKLSNPQFYQDPIVKYGYMIGNQTVNYVNQIMDRWKNYNGNMPYFYDKEYSLNKQEKSNKFTKNTKIIIPDEL